MTRLRRRIAALAVAAALGMLVVAPGATSTDAAFTDAEHANATMTAARLSTPSSLSVTTCVRPLLGNVFMAVQYTLPAQPSGARVDWRVTTPTSTFSVQPEVSTVSPGVYRASFRTGLIGSIESLLGVNVDFEPHTILPGTSWTSPFGQRVRYHAGLISGVSCTLL